MGTTITFSSGSSRKVKENLKGRPGSWGSNLLSPPLNRQVKSKMHGLRVQLTQEVLSGLEKTIKTRSKEAWITSFSVIILLCICMEQAQIAIDGLFMHKKEHQPEEDIPASEIVVDMYRKFDDHLFRHLTEFFHEVFRTRKSRIYNPIRDGYQTNRAECNGEGTEQLVKEVRRIINDHGSY